MELNFGIKTLYCGTVFSLVNYRGRLVAQGLFIIVEEYILINSTG